MGPLNQERSHLGITGETARFLNGISSNDLAIFRRHLGCIDLLKRTQRFISEGKGKEHEQQA
jgi:hypothetical protein